MGPQNIAYTETENKLFDPTPFQILMQVCTQFYGLKCLYLMPLELYISMNFNSI